ncbi:MAG: chromate transporter [Treponema sp.]|jgi:chromate transporter|nr:chromate transporter [Treponema sp.]
MKEWFELIWTFVKIGISTFGGGYTMIPVLERELIKNKGWITMEEVMDYYTIAQITPGIIAVNISTFAGYKRKGAAGGAAATVSFLFPGLVLMTLVSLFMSRFASLETLQHAFTGIRAAVGALVLDTVWKLIRALFKPDGISGVRKAAAPLIAAAAFVLSAAFSAPPALVIAGAGTAGFLLLRSTGKGPDNNLETPHGTEGP